MTTNRSLRAHAIRMSRRFTIPVIALSLVFGVSGIAGALFSVIPTPQTAAVTAAVLAAPTGGSLSASATSTTLPIEWTPPVGYTPTGYTVLRCTGASCTPVSSPAVGTGCAGIITAPNCTDDDPALTPYTAYTYEVIAWFNKWLSSPSAPFSVKTLGIPTVITSASSVNFVAGTSGNFTVTTTGIPSPPVITNADFSSPSPGCTISTPLPGVTFTDNGDGTASIASTSGSPSGTMILCLNATNGVGTPATQSFTLTISSLPLLTFADQYGSNLCSTGKVVISKDHPSATFYVALASNTATDVTVDVTTPNNDPAVTGDLLTIATGTSVSSTPVTVDRPGSNDGIIMTASATGYAPATCELFKNAGGGT